MPPMAASACALPLPAEARIAAVPDGRLLSTGRRIPSSLEPRHVAALGGLHPPQRTSVPLPGIQGNIRAVDAGKIGIERRTRSPIAWSRDLGRAIDYLETRPDIDPARRAPGARRRPRGAPAAGAGRPRGHPRGDVPTWLGASARTTRAAWPSRRRLRPPSRPSERSSPGTHSGGRVRSSRSPPGRRR